MININPFKCLMCTHIMIGYAQIKKIVSLKLPIIFEKLNFNLFFINYENY